MSNYEREKKVIRMSEWVAGGSTSRECKDCGCKHFVIISEDKKACRHCGKEVSQIVKRE